MHASLGMPEPHHAAVGESTDSWNRVSQSVPCSALVQGRKKRIEVFIEFQYNSTTYVNSSAQYRCTGDEEEISMTFLF